jgi:hypothetical protein
VIAGLESRAGAVIFGTSWWAKMKTVACLAVMALVFAVCSVPEGYAQDQNQKYQNAADSEKIGMKGCS